MSWQKLEKLIGKDDFYTIAVAKNGEKNLKG